jgi:hypothetical protein
VAHGFIRGLPHLIKKAASLRVGTGDGPEGDQAAPQADRVIDMKWAILDYKHLDHHLRQFNVQKEKINQLSILVWRKGVGLGLLSPTETPSTRFA